MIGCFLSCLDGVLRLCCSGIVHEMELKKQHDIQKELAQRRQKVADGLALIGTQHGFKNSNMGRVAAVDEHTSPNLKAKCFCDAPLAASQSMNIFALPVIKDLDSRQTHGLLVRSVDDTSNDYQRIGMFQIANK
jgi:hypothetical protein